MQGAVGRVRPVSCTVLTREFGSSTRATTGPHHGACHSVREQEVVRVQQRPQEVLGGLPRRRRRRTACAATRFSLSPGSRPSAARHSSSTISSSVFFAASSLARRGRPGRRSSPRSPARSSGAAPGPSSARSDRPHSHGREPLRPAEDVEEVRRQPVVPQLDGPGAARPARGTPPAPPVTLADRVEQHLGRQPADAVVRSVLLVVRVGRRSARSESWYAREFRISRWTCLQVVADGHERVAR